MNGKRESQLPSDGGTGQHRHNDELTRISTRVPHFPDSVNPQSPTIPTAGGGPLHWAICDALFTLRAELEALGLDCPHTAIVASFAKMLTASYIPAEELAAVEVGQ